MRGHTPTIGGMTVALSRFDYFDVAAAVLKSDRKFNLQRSVPVLRGTAEENLVSCPLKPVCFCSEFVSAFSQPIEPEFSSVVGRCARNRLTTLNDRNIHTRNWATRRINNDSGNKTHTGWFVHTNIRNAWHYPGRHK
jgi:hypothetical protein